jgi:hypothetical protein
VSQIFEKMRSDERERERERKLHCGYVKDEEE